jgi:hypothetical protein
VHIISDPRLAVQEHRIPTSSSGLELFLYVGVLLQVGLGVVVLTEMGKETEGGGGIQSYGGGMVKGRGFGI